MTLGERLTNLRKEKHLSQENVAEKLNVSRQTISKWETDQSTPDFDKIVPLCELYDISSDELLTGIKTDKEILDDQVQNKYNPQKRALGIGVSVLLYFIAVAWIFVSIPYLKLDPILATAIFMVICGIATFIVIYTSMVYKSKEEIKEETDSKELKQIKSVLSIFTVIIYLGISFTTMAWHITWIVWPIYALIIEIIKLMMTLKERN